MACMQWTILPVPLSQAFVYKGYLKRNDWPSSHSFTEAFVYDKLLFKFKQHVCTKPCWKQLFRIVTRPCQRRTGRFIYILKDCLNTRLNSINSLRVYISNPLSLDNTARYSYRPLTFFKNDYCLCKTNL